MQKGTSKYLQDISELWPNEDFNVPSKTSPMMKSASSCLNLPNKRDDEREEEARSLREAHEKIKMTLNGPVNPRYVNASAGQYNQRITLGFSPWVHGWT